MTASGAAGALNGERVATVADLASRFGVNSVVIRDAPTMRWLGAPDGGDSWILIAEGAGSSVAPVEIGGEFDELEAGPAARGWPQISIPARLLADDSRSSGLTAAIANARAVKDADELASIGAAAELVEAGHRGMREVLEPGSSERELWAGAARAIAASGGAPEYAVVDLMVGERTALIGEAPGGARIATGEPVLFDLAPQRDGYWADSCATVACGPPAAALRDRHAAVASALELGLASARPGVSAGAVDAAIRRRLAEAMLECPHHTGHGVGVGAQEPPWFVPGNDFVLEEGMVVALEPGAYVGGFGVRLEHLAVIEPDAARPLTNHALTLTTEGGKSS